MKLIYDTEQPPEMRMMITNDEGVSAFIPSYKVLMEFLDGSQGKIERYGTAKIRKERREKFKTKVG
jgi:hypothetical protein